MLRSSCNSRGRRPASSRDREPRTGRCPPLRPCDLRNDRSSTVLLLKLFEKWKSRSDFQGRSSPGLPQLFTRRFIFLLSGLVAFRMDSPRISMRYVALDYRECRQPAWGLRSVPGNETVAVVKSGSWNGSGNDPRRFLEVSSLCFGHRCHGPVIHHQHTDAVQPL